MVISSDVAFSCLGSESKKLGEKFIVWHSFYLKELGSLEPNFNDDKFDKINYYSSGAEDSWSCHFRSCPFLCFLCLLFIIFYHCTCVCVIFISIKVGGSGTCGLHFFFLASPPLWLRREHWWDVKKICSIASKLFSMYLEMFFMVKISKKELYVIDIYDAKHICCRLSKGNYMKNALIS